MVTLKKKIWMVKNVHRGLKLLTVAVLSCVFLTLAGASLAPAQAAAARPAFVSIGTASAAGAYYPIGVAMADIWNRNISGTRFSSQETGGSVANMNLLDGNQIEVGISNENIAFNAIKGKAPFKHPIDIRGGWVMNNSMVVFISLKKSGITRVADLRGKRVAIGAPGSSANVFGKMVLKAENIGEDQFTPTFLGWQQSADALKDGFVDAALMVGGQPFPAIESLAVRTPINVLQFNTKAFRQLSTYPYTAGKIPASLYRTDADGDAIVIRSIIYLSPKLPDDLVYDMVKTVFANIPALKAAHSSGSQARLLSKEDAEEISLKMHPGIIRYAQEVGAW